MSKAKANKHSETGGTGPAGNSSGQLPDLYQLLGLEPLESDRRRIETALKRLLAQIKALHKTDSKQAQRMARVVELGKQNLLPAERKRAYDAKWEAHFGGGSTSTAAVREGWDDEQLSKLLPAGDPTAAFSLSDYLQSAADAPAPPSEADFNKLRNLLAGKSGIETAREKQAAPDSGSTPGVAAAVLSSTSPQPTATGMSPKLSSNPAVAGARPPQSLAKQIRQKRDRSLLLAIAGVLVSLCVVLGVLFFVMNRPASQSRQPANVALQQPAATQANPSPQATQNANANAANPRPPQGSGLPKVQGLEDAPTAGQNPLANSPPPMAANDSNANDAEAASDRPPAATGAAMDGNMASMAAEPSEVSPPDPVAAMSPAPVPAPAPEPAPEPVLTDEDKAAWQQQMQELRVLLGQQQYAEAERRFSAALELAKHSQQKAQLERLQLVGGLAKQFHAALVDAILGLSAGETFKVKSTDVSYVEGSQSHIVIRMLGRNQSYDLVEIPVGLAMGLADLRLDSVHASTPAKKAAFIILHPNNNRLVLEQAREMLAEAVTAGVVPEEAAAIFDDDYQLD